MDLDIFLDSHGIFLSYHAVIDRIEMLWVVHQIPCRENGVFGNQAGYILRRDHCHFQVAALHSFYLGALGEERAVIVNLNVELARRGGIKLFLEKLESFRLPFVWRAWC